jgi:hypothetical protein
MAVGGQKRPTGKSGGLPDFKSARDKDVAQQMAPQGVTQGKSLSYGYQHKHGGHYVRQQPRQVNQRP